MYVNNLLWGIRNTFRLKSNNCLASLNIYRKENNKILVIHQMTIKMPHEKPPLFFDNVVLSNFAFAGVGVTLLKKNIVTGE